jgi:RNA polymerase sigma-70 factor, ECF subfamily
MQSDLRQELTGMIPHLRAFARSLTGGDRDLADDLVQETLVKAMQAEAQFQPGTNLRAWMFTILRNTFCSHVGKKRHKVECHSDDLERLAWIAAPQEGRLETLAFRRAFQQLSAAHREVLVLSIIQGHSYETIGAICGCEVGTVKSRVNRARAQLKSMLMDGDLPLAPRPVAAVEPAGRAPSSERSTLPMAAHVRPGRTAEPAGSRTRPPA